MLGSRFQLFCSGCEFEIYLKVKQSNEKKLEKAQEYSYNLSYRYIKWVWLDKNICTVGIIISSVNSYLGANTK